MNTEQDIDSEKLKEGIEKDKGRVVRDYQSESDEGESEDKEPSNMKDENGETKRDDDDDLIYNRYKAPQIYIADDKEIAIEIAERFQQIEKRLQNVWETENLFGETVQDKVGLDEPWSWEDDIEKDVSQSEEEILELPEEVLNMNKKDIVQSYEAKAKKLPLKKEKFNESRKPKEDIATFVFDAIKRIKSVDYKGNVSKLVNFSDDDISESESDDDMDNVSDDSTTVQVEKSGHALVNDDENKFLNDEEENFHQSEESASTKEQDNYELVQPINHDSYITDTENSSTEDR